MREEFKKADKEDKLVERQRRKEKRIKDKIKWKKNNEEEEEEIDDISGSDGEAPENRASKRSKIYFDSDNDDEARKATVNQDTVTLQEQEALALKLLNSMHS